ncbi:transporter, hydrophobe/amphiphile efflux-1 (HAE1) family [Pirellula staleyi DSM 6068]|uniref:Transporter, hydrophobe/amphiphile efflux-1 (HAE1) family n=1 Tax=Pirellula staleyi (strain ATCC 27377 / DSM 6068 / ICPB 4128) TaxID=530564 RepID=D2QW78_PIRSD|nr:multidrug efflux RND transporter permease subunit [Pirellula staleyi]ADB15953.1 transporter, hydrophobe/amphiphile efflux-1 (HAE1) family [Pirellula staleyi DSM 6068]
MFSRFFIDHPVFANVIAILTMVIGGVALWRLPVEQYPEITPPTVRVTCVYPGADAQVVASTVAAPIEQQVNGVENMLYMSSTSSSDGSYSLTVTFEIGTNLDDAQVLVQNRVSSAEALLPEEVKRQGLTVKKQSAALLLVITLASDKPELDSLFLANYATLRIRDELSRVKGVGEVTVFGTGNYSMRLWLDPDQLRARGLTVQDVQAAVAEQNVQVAAGQVGQPPVVAENALAFQYTVSTLGRLNRPEQFENIVVKTGEDGRLTYLKDVARVELGAQSYDQFNLKQGAPTANIGIFQLPGANALEVTTEVEHAMERLAKSFPQGVSYTMPLNTTKFVEASIHEVYKTLLEAGVLVLIVILVFLQDWRAVLIPATTVPVTLIGAFAAMAWLGFSVNMLTLFGLVLAIGIVVDDAIVIVENAAHHIEKGEKPKQATIRAMDEVLGPIIGITLVLLAVFIPSAAMSGITGQLYRQFALTIAATAVISAINAVTLKPAQCALWLRPPTGKKNIFFRGFNYVYGHCENVYIWIVGGLLRQMALVVVAFVALVLLTGWWYTRVPTGFLPTEDQGYLFVAVQLPDAASQERTKSVMRQIDDKLASIPGVADWISIGGLSLLDNSTASNAGTLFVTLDNWEERLQHEGQSLNEIMGMMGAKFAEIDEAVIFPFAPPAIRGLGVRGGFEMQVQDRADVGLNELQTAMQEVIDEGMKNPSLASIRSTFRPGVPQLFIEVDRVKVKSLDVPLLNVFGTLQAYLGSSYVNDFNKFGRTYQVRVQAEPQFRAEPEDILRLEVRSSSGKMVPMSTLAAVKPVFGPQTITRYNLYPSASVGGEPAPGFSSGDSLKLLESIADEKLPQSIGFEWTGMSYQEKRVGNEAIGIFVMAVLLVYLVLAAQYESWITPIAVILVVPLGLLGAIAAVSILGLDNNLYTQIGIVLIIALASKNAILIVEFARELRHQGKSIVEASVEAARMRFRPILMTSFAFILGVVPLVIAEGAGAAGQRALGTAVFGGMIASTVLSVFFVPIFYVLFQGLSEWLSPRVVATEEPAQAKQPAQPAIASAKATH